MTCRDKLVSTMNMPVRKKVKVHIRLVHRIHLDIHRNRKIETAENRIAIAIRNMAVAAPARRKVSADVCDYKIII